MAFVKAALLSELPEGGALGDALDVAGGHGLQSGYLRIDLFRVTQIHGGAAQGFRGAVVGLPGMEGGGNDLVLRFL